MIQYEEMVRCDIFHGFRMNSIPYYQQCKDRWPELDPKREETIIQSLLEYLQFPEEDIHLPERDLVPDTGARPTANEIG
jgi:hypothetical protein